MSESVWLAIALVLLLEGLMPLLIPEQWQNLLRSLSQQPLQSVRAVGGGLVSAAFVILWWLSSQN